MAITDLQISEELMTDAPSIKYRGDEGPKSPQQMADALLREEYEKYVYDLLEQRPDATPMSFEEFRRMVIGEGMMGRGPVVPSDEDPINPFGPKPMGPLPDDPTKPVNPFGPKREMAAYGGIMGMDGRKQYGIGSFFQEKIMDPLKKNPIVTATLAALGANYFDIIPGSKSSKGYLDFIIDPVTKVITEPRGEGDNKYTIGEKIKEGLSKNIVPALGGIAAGLFTKNNQDTPGIPSDNTALQLAELKKAANLATQKQGLAAGLNFLPDVAARQFSPEEMAIEYAKTAKAANGGRIGFSDGGEDLSNDPNYKGWVKTYEMNPDAAAMNENHSQYLAFYNRNKNNKAEGGIMDLGGLEKDYRNTGGFVEIGAKEKADDVPARLSVNEFVFTADAVRNAGGGDIDEGAKVMERVMKHLEDGGQLSRESQGMGGAREMFEVSERLSEVV